MWMFTIQKGIFGSLVYINRGFFFGTQRCIKCNSNINSLASYIYDDDDEED